MENGLWGTVIRFARRYGQKVCRTASQKKSLVNWKGKKEHERGRKKEKFWDSRNNEGKRSFSVKGDAGSNRRVLTFCRGGNSNEKPGNIARYIDACE